MGLTVPAVAMHRLTSRPSDACRAVIIPNFMLDVKFLKSSTFSLIGISSTLLRSLYGVRVLVARVGV